MEGKRMMYENLGINDQISTNLKQQTDVLLNARGKMDTISKVVEQLRRRADSRPQAPEQHQVEAAEEQEGDVGSGAAVDAGWGLRDLHVRLRLRTCKRLRIIIDAAGTRTVHPQPVHFGGVQGLRLKLPQAPHRVTRLHPHHIAGRPKGTIAGAQAARRAHR